MSLTVSLVDYIESKTSLVTDTNLFVGADVVETADSCVIIVESPGAGESWSGLQERPFQIVAKALSYVGAETLANTVFDLLANRPGFPSGDLDENIFYCNVISRPAFIDRDERGRFIFTANILVRRPK